MLPQTEVSYCMQIFFTN